MKIIYLILLSSLFAFSSEMSDKEIINKLEEISPEMLTEMNDRVKPKICTMQFMTISKINPETGMCETIPLSNGCVIDDYNKGLLKFSNWEDCELKETNNPRLYLDN